MVVALVLSSAGYPTTARLGMLSLRSRGVQVSGADPLDIPLPADVMINHLRFAKGVSLRTLVEAARRWHTIACKAAQIARPGGLGQNARDALRLEGMPDDQSKTTDDIDPRYLDARARILSGETPIEMTRHGETDKSTICAKCIEPAEIDGLCRLHLLEREANKSTVPAARSRGESPAPRLSKISGTVRHPMDDTIFPIPIRPDLTVRIQGLPLDLTPVEADKLAAVIMAYVEVKP